MKTFILAVLLGSAALMTAQQGAQALELRDIFGRSSERVSERPAPAPVQLAQAGASTVQIDQMQEQIRQLNGRIEEMSFQLLQMQEQMRKTQEDNEFRFQDLEKAKGAAPVKKSGALETPVDAGAPADSVAQVITETPAQTAPATAAPSAPAPAASGNSGAPPRTLGSIEMGANGMPKSATLAEPTKDNTALPGIDNRNTAAVSPQIASLDGEKDIYQAAYSHVLAGDYSLAEAQFRDFIQRYPKSDKIADANFWLGEAEYSQGNYNEAAKTFLNAHQAYSNSPKAPEMLLKLGMSLAALDNVDTACATLREVSKRYPKASRPVLTKVGSEQKRLAC